jgi:hypothetical protein
MEERRGQNIHFRPLKLTPGCVQRHSLKFNTPPCDYKYAVCMQCVARKGGIGCVEDDTYTSGLLHSAWGSLQNC